MSYLEKVLHDGSGTCFPDIVRLESRILFSPALWDHQDDLEVVNERIIQGEIPEDHSPKTRPGTTEVRESGTGHFDDVMSPGDHEIKQKFLRGPGAVFTKRAPGRRTQKNKKKIGLQETNEKVDIQSPKVEGYQFKEGDRDPTVEIGKDAVLQKQESSGQLQIQPQPRPQLQKTGIAEPQKEKIQSIPGTANQEPLHEPGIFVKTVEVSIPGTRGISESAKKSQTAAAGDVNQKQKSPEQLQPQLQPQLQKTGTAEPQKEKIQIPSISPGQRAQEPLPEPGIVVKTIEIPGESAKKSEKPLPPLQLQPQPQPKKAAVSGLAAEKTPIPATGAEQETVHETGRFVKRVEVPVKPKGPRKPDVHLSGQSSKKREKPMDSIVNEIASIKKKLDEHIRNEHSEPEPQKPVFLPKRPPSHNLGGWSDLERNALYRRH